MSDKKLAFEGASQLYLLSMYDAIDRLDTLLLEARHLQVNIISTLRSPKLLDALRFEEKHLWGNNWHRSLRKHSAEKLVDKWTVCYPHAKYLHRYIKEKKPKKTDVIRKNLYDLLVKTIENSIWGKEQFSAYYTLEAIQHLKRKILKDKIILIEHAVDHSHLYRHTEGDINNSGYSAKAEFMVLRGAILFNAELRYVEKLKQYHN